MLDDHADLYLTKADKPFVFRDLSAFTPGVSRLVFMLDYARRTTLDSVAGLSTAQLDAQPLTQGNTIGLLLAHAAHVEATYQSVTFRGVLPSGRNAESVFGAAGRKTYRGHDLAFYLERLRATRDETLSELARRDDAWLHEAYRPWGETPMNNLFCWFHVAEDEINHRGQIRVLRKELELSSRSPE